MYKRQLYLLALESQLFDECMIGGEIDWNGIFPEADNVQNEIDVILRKGRSITFISCKMTDLSVEAINELEVYANHFAGESCLKLIVCTGKINPVYANRCQEYGCLLYTSLQLGLYRFLFGLGTGALIPGVNALLSKMTPKSGISRIFAFNQVFFYLGGVIGPMAGSAVAGYLGYHAVFYATAACVAFSCLCNLVQFRSLLKVKEI